METQPIKRLYRSRRNRRFCGICGGLEKYLESDATIIRLAMLAIGILTGGMAIVAYLIAAVIIPVDPTE